jgi:hypothetical protein
MRLSADNPYPGLRPFDEDDAEFFFGREDQVSALFRRVHLHRFVAVVGASGSGKSSMVRAGLVPALRRSKSPRWRCITIRPETTPFENLANALFKLDGGKTESSEAAGLSGGLGLSRLKGMLLFSSEGLAEAVAELALDDNERVLVVIDQFEELIRFDQKTLDTSLRFIRLLLRAAEQKIVPVNIMITMRLDFLADCARYSGLTEQINQGQYLVPALDRYQRTAAIVAPAEKAGREIAWPLVQALLNDADDAHDQLPVLQHGLMRLWDEAGGDRLLTLEHYQKTGRLGEAIARHAGKILSDLTAPEKVVAERLFKALTELDKQARGIRHSQKFGDLCTAVGLRAGEQDESNRIATLRNVIDKFRAAPAFFLMPPAPSELTAETVIDISHESLIRQWPQISGDDKHTGWLQDEARDGRHYNVLVEDAINWKFKNFDPPGGEKLRDYTRMQARPGLNGHWGMRYLTADQRERLGGKPERVDSLVKEFMKAAEHQAARKRLVKRFAVVFGAGAFLLGVVTISLQYKNKALDVEREIAEAQRVLAEGERELANKQRARAEAALAAAEELTNQLRTANEDLTQAMDARAAAEAQTEETQADLRKVGVGSLVAIIDRLQSEKAYLKAMLVLRRALNLVIEGRLEPDARLIAGGYTALNQIRELEIADVGGPVYRMALSLDGTRIAAGNFDSGGVNILDSSDVSVAVQQLATAGGVADLTYLSGGGLAVLSRAGIVEVFGADGSGPIRFEGAGKLDGDGFGIELAAHPGGRWIVAASPGQPGLSIIDLQAGTSEFAEFADLEATALAFDPRGHRLVVGTNSGEVRLFEFGGGFLKRVKLADNPIEPEKTTSRIHAVAFSPDGTKIAIGSEGGRVVVRNAENWKVIATKDIESAIYNLEWLSIGNLILVSGGGGFISTLKLHEAASGTVTQARKTNSAVARLEVAGDFSIDRDIEIGTTVLADRDDALIVSTDQRFIRKIAVETPHKLPSALPTKQWNQPWSMVRARLTRSPNPLFDCSTKAIKADEAISKALKDLKIEPDRLQRNVCAAALSATGEFIVLLFERNDLALYSVTDKTLVIGRALDFSPDGISISPSGDRIAVQSGGIVSVLPVANTAMAILSLIEARIPKGMTPEIEQNMLSSDDLDTLQRLEGDTAAR